MTGQYINTSPQGDVAYATYTGVTSYFNYFGQECGYDDYFNAGSSGSGWARNGDTVPFNNATRLADVIARNPDCVVLGSPGNDTNNGVTGSAASSSADTALSTLRTALPDSLFIILGLGTLEGSSTSAAIDAALRSKAQEYGAWYIQPYGSGEVVNPSGAVTTTLTPADLNTYMSNDGQHPSQEGAMIIGKVVAKFVKACHPA